MDLSPLAPRPNLRQEVYHILRRRLTELASNSSTPVRVREAELARSLRVSRTPVREALSRLAEEGLLTIIPHRGVQLVPTSLDEYVAWLEVREVLEGLAARLATRRASPKAVARLRAIFAPHNEGTIGRGSPDYARANAEFHNLIIEEAGNSVLRRFGQHYDHLQMVRFRVIERLGRARQSLREHLAIIDAIERKNGRQAERLARHHVRQLRLAVQRQLKTIEAEGTDRTGEAPRGSVGARRDGAPQKGGDRDHP